MADYRTNYRVWGLTAGALFLPWLGAVTWEALTKATEISARDGAVLAGVVLFAVFPAALVGWLAQAVWPLLVGDPPPDQHVADYGPRRPAP